MPMKPSSTFASSRYLRKSVDEANVIGYAVWATRDGIKLMPIYAAEYRAIVNTGKRAVTHFLATHEIGEPLNSALAADDPGAAHLAQLAAWSIAALVDHHQLRRKHKPRRRRA